MDVTIILPTKNEEECIGRMLKEVQDLNLGLKILVVDDSSNTKTKEAALQTANDCEVDLTFLGGKGNESPSIRYSLGQCNTEYAVIMDADLSQDPRIIPKMIAELEG